MQRNNKHKIQGGSCFWQEERNVIQKGHTKASKVFLKPYGDLGFLIFFKLYILCIFISIIFKYRYKNPRGLCFPSTKICKSASSYGALSHKGLHTIQINTLHHAITYLFQSQNLAQFVMICFIA